MPEAYTTTMRGRRVAVESVTEWYEREYLPYADRMDRPALIMRACRDFHALTGMDPDTTPSATLLALG